jgi:hypothetical protein
MISEFPLGYIRYMLLGRNFTILDSIPGSRRILNLGDTRGLAFFLA